MKGIVFTHFIEMVEQRFSIDLASQMIESCDLPSGGVYSAVGTYDHREMVSMLVALSGLTGVAIPDLLKSYGGYLFQRFAQFYPHFFEGHTSALTFVGSIESVIHVEVRKLYPDAELPRFETLESTPDSLRIIYRSQRHLADLAEGLIHAAVEHFGETGVIAVRRDDLDEPDQPTCFSLLKHP